MPRLALSLLGSYEATLDGEPISGFESAKVQALLAYLAMEADRPHRRDALAALLWPEWPDRVARTNLRHVLASLRKTIGDREAETPLLLVTRETVQFDSASDYWLDVGRFEECMGASGPLQGSARGLGASVRLEEAVALYRGSFLEGFSLKGASSMTTGRCWCGSGSTARRWALSAGWVNTSSDAATSPGPGRPPGGEWGWSRGRRTRTGN